MTSTKLELLKIQSEIQQRNNSNSGEIINAVDGHNYDRRVLSATIKSIITLPFFASLGWEICTSFKKSKDENASTDSKIIMFAGIFLAGFLLPALYFFQVFEYSF